MRTTNSPARDHFGLKECTKGEGGKNPSTVGVGHSNAVGTFGHMRQIIVQTEGVSGLWKGNVTRMAKITPV